jgi:DNA-binding MarR family transcriptional regulator
MQDDTFTRQCACTTLRKASRALSRLYDDALAGTGLTINQFSILRTLAREGDLPLSRLADRLVTDRTSLYRALTPIERAGWISIGDAKTGKARIAAITPAGHDAIRSAAPLWEATQRHIVGALGADGWAALSAGLENLTTLAVATPR